MFTKKTENSDLALAIAHFHSELGIAEAGSEKSLMIVEQLVKLYEVQIAQQRQNRISADALTGVVANLSGILLIMNHERAAVIATKAFGLLARK